MSATISPGCRGARFAWPRPSRPAAPGARFCRSTSAPPIRFSSTLAASGCFTSSVTLRFPRFSQMKKLAWPWTKLSYDRAKSPSPGRSILITVAPRSAMCREQIGAATACSSATTRMPSRGSTIDPAFLRFRQPGKPRVKPVSKRDRSDGGQFIGDARSTGEDRVAVGRSITGHKRTEARPGLRQDGQSRGDVPQVDVQLQVRIDAASSDIGQAESAGPAQARHGAGGNDAIGERDELFMRPPTRPAELDGGTSEIGGFSCPDRRAVQCRAGAGASCEGLVQCGRDNNADHRRIAVQAAERYAEPFAAAHEVGGAVDRIDHPAQAARASGATFLTLEPVRRICLRQTPGQQALHRTIGVGKPVLCALQFGRRCTRRGTQPQSKRRRFSGEPDSGVEAIVECVHRIPARMKLCTNWRWKSRNATSNGALVIKVAAVTMDQSMPWSVVAKTARPTVSGRVVTELVIINGQRKLFQW